jgi:hypothetical protein
MKMPLAGLPLGFPSPSPLLGVPAATLTAEYCSYAHAFGSPDRIDLAERPLDLNVPLDGNLVAVLPVLILFGAHKWPSAVLRL